MNYSADINFLLMMQQLNLLVYHHFGVLIIEIKGWLRFLYWLLELLTNIVDACLHISIQNSITSRSANNITLETIFHSSQLNNAISFSERLNMYLNDEAHLSQTINLEQRLLQFNERFDIASNAIWNWMLGELNA